MPDYGIHIIMQQARVAQFADNEWQAARCRKMVHIGLPVGIHANQQRDNGRDFVKIVPIQNHARRARHRHQVHGVVGGAACCHQAYHGVDKRFFAQHFAQRFQAA